MLAAYPRSTIYHCDIQPRCTVPQTPIFPSIQLLKMISAGTGRGDSGEVEPLGGGLDPSPTKHLLEAISTGCSDKHELHMSCLYERPPVIPGKGDTATATATLTTVTAATAAPAPPEVVGGVAATIGETETETVTMVDSGQPASAFRSFSCNKTVSLPCGCELEHGRVWRIVMALRAELWREGSPSAATPAGAADAVPGCRAAEEEGDGRGGGGSFEAPGVGGGEGRKIEDVLGDRPWGLQDAADMKLERAREIFAFPIKTR